MRMKIKNVFLVIIMSLVLSGIVPSLPYEATTQFFTVEAATKVKMNKTKATLIKGQKLQLKLIGNKKKVKWSSSNKKVATVSNKGKVTAKAKGKATITARVGSKRYVCKITVETPKISKKSITLEVGETYALKISGTKQKVKWKTSNNSVASVSSKGKITARKAGNATITATVGSKKYTCKVTVKAKEPDKPEVVRVSEVKLNILEYTMETGESVQLTAKINPSNATDKTVTWSSSNANVATVTNTGLVNGKSAGTAIITVKTNDGGKTCSCKITIKPEVIPVSDVTLDISTQTIEVGKNVQLTATVSPSNATDKTVTWSSSNTNVATVTDTGLVNGRSEGTATITVKTRDGGKICSCTIMVKKPAPTMEDYYEKLRIYILSYGGTNADGNKFIKKTENVNGSLFTSAIIYEKATDQYLFMMSVEDGRSVSVVQMTVNVLKSGHVQPEYVFVYENAGIAFQTKALIPVGTYTGNDDIYFDVIKTTGSLSSSQMQTLSNQALKAAFSGWELLLYDYVGISLKDLGFTSYDV